MVIDLFRTGDVDRCCRSIICVPSGTHLSGAAAFLRHTASKVEEKRKRLFCGKRGFYRSVQYRHITGTVMPQIDGTGRAAFIRMSRIS